MLLKTYWLFLAIIPPIIQCKQNILPDDAEKTKTEIAVSDLIFRIIGDRYTSFKIFIEPSLHKSELDLFKIIKTKDLKEVQIYGTSGVAAAWGFHYYLKEYCNSHVSWDGDNINLPSELPDVNISITANDKYRYYQNVVTTSYSFVWWNWTRWEREIDWMALNGINLALAFNGQEEIWRRVYLELHLDDDDINNYFTGPAFLSWNRMGNIRSWGGPLTKSWHSKSVELQKLILKRMRDFGITPVLPAFSGFVPRAFKRIYESADVSTITWLKFSRQYCCIYLLSPFDEMFSIIASLFLKEYIKEFGTNHIYISDSFNEMLPPNITLNYLKLFGETLFKTMIDVDKDAIWLMQGWLFHNAEHFWNEQRSKALLTSVPQGRMLILDLQAELNPQYKRLNSFFGQPFIWCMLHNFGGTLGLQGNLKSINEDIFTARSFENSTMIGTGIVPEGINQNYVVYDLMAEMAWRKESVNLTKWLENYSTRRYGCSNENALQAWILLMNSVYSYFGVGQHGDYIFVLRPSFQLTENVWYDKEDVWKAWEYLLKASQEMHNITETFLYDLVDVTRQSLQLYLDKTYEILYESFQFNNTAIFKVKTETFLNLLTDMDKILATLPHFLLGKWIYDAKAMGNTPLEKSVFERNARNQITLWGPNGEINDYANKQWSGLVQDYYYERWKLFLSLAYSSMINNTRFDQEKIEWKIFKLIEQPFSFSSKSYTILPTGDPAKIALELNKKWSLLFKDS